MHAPQHTKRFRHRVVALSALAALLLAACAGGDGGGGDEATGGFEIWYSNNPEEITWGQEQVEAWNAEHPDEQITAQEIPAGDTSEEVITAAITGGNAPCLIYNVAPAAVPMFERQGGLVALDELEGGEAFITERLGDVAEQYRSPDGSFRQLPWKSNPVMIFYNKALMEEAGVDPDDPPLATYDEFLDTARAVVDSGAADRAIWPAPTSEFFQSWFDFYPMFASATGGDQLVMDGESRFDSPEGLAVDELWRTMYAEGLASQEAYQGDAFGEGVAAMSAAGPWAILTYEDLDWGVAPMPTPDGAEDPWTFSDAKSVGLFSACESTGSAWAFLQQTMSEEADGAMLETTGQMPLRTDLPETYPEYFADRPEYELFADQAARTVEVPNVPNSIEVWQEFRSAWSESVIFDESPITDRMAAAAETIDGLVAEE